MSLEFHCSWYFLAGLVVLFFFLSHVAQAGWPQCYYKAEDGREATHLLLSPPESWGYRHVPLYLT